MTAAEVPLNAEARVPRWFIWLGLIGLAAYAGLLAVNMTAVAGGSDSSGYLNSAKLFAEGKVRTPLRVPPEFATRAVDPIHFMPGGFKTFPVHRDLAPSYPAGFPLHLALGGRLLGWRAGPFCVQMMAAVGAVWLCYLAARALGLHFALAAAGAVMLAASPVFLYTAVQTLSDTLATTWSLAALLCALRGRASARWAAAAGAALALAVLVRPTNLLIAPGLVILLGFDARRIGWFVLGGVPGAIWLLLYHHFLYGGALRSGYGDIFAAFAWENLAPTAAHYGKWLPLFLPAVVLVLPFAALARHDPHRRESIAFLLIFAAVTGLYLFCAFSHEAWTCLRYLLPVVPALILAALLGLEALARGPAARWPRVFRPAAALILALWAAGGSWHLSRQLGVFWIPVYERAYEEAARYVREHVPANGLVACGLLGGAVYYYTEHPTLLADSIEPEQFLRYVRVARQAGRPIFAAVFVTEEPDTIRRHCPGGWTRIAGAGNIGIWRLDAERAEDVKRDAPR